MDGWAIRSALQAGAPPWFSTVPPVASAGPGARRHGLASCPAWTLALKESDPAIPSIEVSSSGVSGARGFCQLQLSSPGL